MKKHRKAGRVSLAAPNLSDDRCVFEFNVSLGGGKGGKKKPVIS